MNFKCIWLVCVLATMVCIFMFSSQEGKESNKTSDIIVVPMENSLKAISDKKFSDKKEEEAYWTKIYKKLDYGVRKTAHVVLYGTLGIFCVLFFKSCGMSWGDIIMLSLLVCAVYAGTDELHQKFNKRTAQFADVCIDTFGAWIGTGIVYMLNKVKKRKKHG